MLGLHWTPEGLGTDLRPKKNTRQLVSKVVCSSHVAHQKVISYSWILAITRVYSALKSTSSTTAFNCKNGRGTCQFHLRVTQLAARSSFGRKSSRVGHKSLDGFVCHLAWSQITLEMIISCKPSQTGNSRRSRQGRGSVAKQSQSITGQSEAGHKCITMVWLWLWFWGPSSCW